MDQDSPTTTGEASKYGILSIMCCIYVVNIVSGDYEAIHLGSALSKVAWITKTILPNNAGVCRHQDIHCQPSLFSLQLLSDPTDLAYLTLYLLEEANNKIL